MNIIFKIFSFYLRGVVITGFGEGVAGGECKRRDIGEGRTPL